MDLSCRKDDDDDDDGDGGGDGGGSSDDDIDDYEEGGAKHVRWWDEMNEPTAAATATKMIRGNIIIIFTINVLFYSFIRAIFA